MATTRSKSSGGTDRQESSDATITATMTTVWRAGAATAALLAVACGACPAGTIRHDRLDSDYRAYAAEPQFAPVGSYSTGVSFGSFTLIAPQWALTAAHVVDTDLDGRIDDEDLSRHSFTVGGQRRTAVEAIVPIGINGNPGWDGNINRGFDIALTRLNQPITSVVPATIYTAFQELGAVMTAAGFGQGGTGKTGATGSAGTKRAGDNVVDEFVTFDNGATGLRWDFDEPAPRTSPNFSGSTIPLDLEYSIAPGDSGGGAFLFEGGAWYLAGVNSGTYDLFAYPDATSNRSTYGDAVLVTRVAAYQKFIFSAIPEIADGAFIPEPSHLAVLVFAGAWVGRRRRR